MANNCTGKRACSIGKIHRHSIRARVVFKRVMDIDNIRYMFRLWNLDPPYFDDLSNKVESYLPNKYKQKTKNLLTSTFLPYELVSCERVNCPTGHMLNIHI